MRKSIEIKIENEGRVAPLYRQYEGQNQPQDAYIEIDPRGDQISVSAEISTSVGSGCSMDVWHGRVYRIDIPSPMILGRELEDYLNSVDFWGQVLDLCEDYKELWDGSNMVGRWNDDASDIVYQIQAELFELECARYYDGSEWVEDSVTYHDAEGNEVHHACDATSARYDSGTLDVAITADTVDRIVDDARSTVDDCGDVIVEGIQDAVEYILEEMEYNQD